jgi:hypothetical protein
MLGVGAVIKINEMKKYILITLLILPSKLFSQSIVENYLNNISLDKAPARDYNNLSRAFYFIYTDTTFKLFDIADITMWFQKDKLYLSQYKMDGSLLMVDNGKPTFSKNSSGYDFMSSDFLKYIAWGELHDIRANLKFDKKDYNGAINDWEIFIDSENIKNKSVAVVYYNIGVSYYNLHDLKDACKYMEIAEDLGDEKASTYLSSFCDFPINK